MKNKTRGEKGALFMLTRFTSLGVERSKSTWISLLIMRYFDFLEDKKIILYEIMDLRKKFHSIDECFVFFSGVTNFRYSVTN